MVDGDPTRWQASFEMGSEFGVGGPLEVVAIPANGPARPPFVTGIEVVDPPAGLFGAAVLAHDQSSDNLRYVVDDSLFDLTIWDGDTSGDVPQNMPLFGGGEFEVGASIMFEGEVRGDGTADLDLFEVSGGAMNGLSAAGLSFGFGVGGGLLFDYQPASQAWQPGGQLDLALDFEADVPPNPVYFTTPIGPVYGQGIISSSAMLDFQLTDWPEGSAPEWQADLSLDPLVKATAVLGYGLNNVVAAELHLGGGVAADLMFPSPQPVTRLDIVLTGDVIVDTFRIRRGFQYCRS